jgi:hypothetical protein
VSDNRAKLANWTFAKDAFGDWRGTHVNGRRTALKGSLTAAEADALAGRVVCRNWPNCEHRDADACTRAIQAARRQRRAA